LIWGVVIAYVTEYRYSQQFIDIIVSNQLNFNVIAPLSYNIANINTLFYKYIFCSLYGKSYISKILFTMKYLDMNFYIRN